MDAYEQRQARIWMTQHSSGDDNHCKICGVDWCGNAECLEPEDDNDR